MEQHASASLVQFEAWVQRRLAALEKMEVKLREMRTLAEYAAGRSLAPSEVAQVQEWMNVLHCEVLALDQETMWHDDYTLHSAIS